LVSNEAVFDQWFVARLWSNPPNKE
jgi:hypothetical protein